MAPTSQLFMAGHANAADRSWQIKAMTLRRCGNTAIAYQMQPVIPLRIMKRKPEPGLPRLFDKPRYAQRNIIERRFGWLKDNRRIGTHYDKLAESFPAMVSLACSLRCLKQLVWYTA